VVPFLSVTDLQVRPDISPLCPAHHISMNVGPEEDYVCPEPGCAFCWHVDEGYFQLKDGKVLYPTNIHQLLKPALVTEHGYMYIASVEGVPPKRTWRCAMRDCPNFMID
jgi:hypothetical protein